MFLEKFIGLGAYQYKFGYILDCNLGQMVMFPPATTVHVNTYCDNLVGLPIQLTRLEQMDTVIYLLGGVKSEA